MIGTGKFMTLWVRSVNSLKPQSQMVLQILQPGVTLRSTSGHKNCFSRHNFNLGWRELDRIGVSFLNIPDEKETVLSRPLDRNTHTAPKRQAVEAPQQLGEASFLADLERKQPQKSAPRRAAAPRALTPPRWRSRHHPRVPFWGRKRARAGRVVPQPTGWMKE